MKLPAHSSLSRKSTFYKSFLPLRLVRHNPIYTCRLPHLKLHVSTYQRVLRPSLLYRAAVPVPFLPLLSPRRPLQALIKINIHPFIQGLWIKNRVGPDPRLYLLWEERLMKLCYVNILKRGRNWRRELLRYLLHCLRNGRRRRLKLILLIRLGMWCPMYLLNSTRAVE